MEHVDVAALLDIPLTSTSPFQINIPANDRARMASTRRGDISSGRLIDVAMMIPITSLDVLNVLAERRCRRDDTGRTDHRDRSSGGERGG